MSERALVPFHEWAADQSAHFQRIADSIDDVDDVVPVLRELCESYSTALKVLAADAADAAKPPQMQKQANTDCPHLRMWIFNVTDGGEFKYQTYGFGLSLEDCRKDIVTTLAKGYVATCIGWH